SSRREESAERERMEREAQEIEEALKEIDLSIAPLIHVDRELHDFGQIRQGKDVETSFLISNTGKGDLKIENVQSGCGCATVTDLTGKIIPPGGSEELVVRLNTDNKALNLTKSVKIYSNDPITSPKRISIKAYIQVDYLLRTPILKFKEFRRDSCETKRISIDSFMDLPLQIDDFQCDKEFIRCVFGELEDGRSTHFIDVTVDAENRDLGNETVYGKVSFKSNSSQIPGGSFTVIIEPIEDIKYEPRKVFLYRYSHATREEVVVNLENVLGKPFSIQSVDPGIEHITVEIDGRNESKATVKLLLKENAEKGRYNGTIKIAFDYEGQASLEIPITVLIME
ncbi:MAG: DUF1573 domain-containing protein, partial [Planctomycetes bacterium]|nr:DUF1573 domain-containing protein [Planctomycetota bacterium]